MCPDSDHRYAAMCFLTKLPPAIKNLNVWDWFCPSRITIHELQIYFYKIRHGFGLLTFSLLTVAFQTIELCSSKDSPNIDNLFVLPWHVRTLYECYFLIMENLVYKEFHCLVLISVTCSATKYESRKYSCRKLCYSERRTISSGHLC